MAPSEVVRTRTCDIWLDRIVHARFHDGAMVSLADAEENIAATARIAGRPRPVLIDLRLLRSQSAAARAYLAGPEATKVSTAVALLVASPVSRVIGNFYLGFNRPEVPTRLFGDGPEAEAWLVQFLGATDDG